MALQTNKLLNLGGAKLLYDDLISKIAVAGKVKKVNNTSPDETTGNVQIDATNINVDDTAETPTTVSESLTSQLSRITQLDANVKSTAQAKAEYHMGFYRDADGDLCEA